MTTDSNDTIDYGTLMHHAMRRLIQSVLEDVAHRGLPGDHHFFITFATTHPRVDLADWLRERYPDEMTVVMQEWFDGLDVTDDGFAVTLNFGNAPEPLYIPFDAIHTFVDPSVEFGLRFDGQDSSPDPDDPGPDPAPDPDTDTDTDHQVVSLDQFRKR